MTLINTIRRLRSAEPFVPFRIRLKDGRMMVVTDPWTICFNCEFTAVHGLVDGMGLDGVAADQIEAVEVQAWVDATKGGR
jgi:hypothetical protein